MAKLTAADELASLKLQRDLLRSELRTVTEVLQGLEGGSDFVARCHDIVPRMGAVLRLPPQDTPRLDAAVRRPLVGVGVAVTCAADPKLRGKFLVGSRKGSHGAGSFAFPGGHLEHGETWAACAARELAEEAGLELEGTRFDHVATTNDLMVGGLHYVTIFMHVDVPAAVLPRLQNLEPDKCDGWLWLSPEELRVMHRAQLFTSLHNFLNQATTRGKPGLLLVDEVLAAAERSAVAETHLIPDTLLADDRV